MAVNSMPSFLGKLVKRGDCNKASVPLVGKKEPSDFLFPEEKKKKRPSFSQMIFIQSD